MPSPCRFRASSPKGVFAVVAFAVVGLLGLGILSPVAWGKVTFHGPDPWPRFRGPNGQGVSTGTIGLLTTWTDEELAWKVKLPGSGFSSPVVWGNKVFVTASDDSAEKGFLLAYSIIDGRELWRREFDLPKYRMNALNNAASSTPAVDAADGKVAWEVADALNARVCSSPVLAGDLVIATCGEGGGGKRLTAVRPPKNPGDKPQIAYQIEDSTVAYVPTAVAYRDCLFTVHDNGTISPMARSSGPKSPAASSTARRSSPTASCM
jgi:hypothetical protein